MSNNINKFCLILYSCKRAKQLHIESNSKVIDGISKKDTTIALKEVLFNLVNRGKLRKFILNDFKCNIKSDSSSSI